MSDHSVREATPIRPRLEWISWPNVMPLSGAPIGPIVLKGVTVVPRAPRVQAKIDGLMRKYTDAGSPTPERVACYRLAQQLCEKYPDRARYVLPSLPMTGGWLESGRGIRYDVYPSGASSVIHARGAVRFDWGSWGKEYATLCGRGRPTDPHRPQRVTCLDCLALAEKKRPPMPVFRIPKRAA